ncbi:hypothetical protein LINGRAHAP2_LOCUS6604, partial [Linum grandiflorum]
MRKVGLSFFNDCPMEDKLMYRCSSDSAASEGYGSKVLVDSDENHGILDWRDYFDHHTLPLTRQNPSNFLITLPIIVTLKSRRVLGWHPTKTKNISPAPEIVSESSPQRYQEVNYGDYMSRWYTKGPEGKQNTELKLKEKIVVLGGLVMTGIARYME